MRKTAPALSNALICDCNVPISVGHCALSASQATCQAAVRNSCGNALRKNRCSVRSNQRVLLQDVDETETHSPIVDEASPPASPVSDSAADIKATTVQEFEDK